MSALLGACDLAVFDGGGPGPTRDWDPAPWAGPPAIAPALAAGVPVVAPAWAIEGPSRVGLYAAHNSTLPELVRGLMELAQDPERRERMGREAREQCGPERCGDGFVRGTNEVWEEATVGEAALG
jgi:glycosyltransferase involved in cell wall biosynthesis